MYMIEISEDKVDNLLEHMTKGVKCFAKAIDCLEDIKEDSRMRSRYEDGGVYEPEEDDDYEPRDYRQEGNKQSPRRYRNSGRYSRY